MLMFNEMDNIVMSDQEFLASTDGAPRYYKVCGEVNRIMYDRFPTYYAACPECKKKVMPNDMTSGFYCEKC